MRINVARDAQPVVPSGKADPAREKARLAAVKSLALQARMLCGAARLLLSPAQPEGPLPGGAELGAQLDAATAALKKLDAELAGAAGSPRTTPAPIDQASRVRAGCLAALTAARRAATPVTRAPGVGDALLSALSAAGTWSPVRDDRGVVVTLRGLFAGPKLTPAGEARLRDLARVAAAHPSFPVAVVVHTDRDVSSREEPALAARAEAVVHVLKSAQVASDAGAPPPNPRIEPFVAGSAAPVVDPSGSDRARNARVEIIFVTPETI
jgi:outer membrane protein OmpA-like peptidoglycan-associated protein